MENYADYKDGLLERNDGALKVFRINIQIWQDFLFIGCMLRQ